MSNTIVTQAEQEQHHPFLPLTTVRMAHDEAYWLARELQGSEKLTWLEAESRAARMVRELEAYRDDWDTLAYKAGNPVGLPF